MAEGTDLRIVYMGTPEFAVAPLRALVESGHRIIAVVTAPDKPAGRGLKTQESAVKRYAAAQGLKILQPVKLRDPEFLEELRSLSPDLGIVIAFRMLPEAVWSMPRHGTFNLHASLLPQYRGAAPINRAVMNGECETGVTTFMLNHEIDKGAVVGQRRIPIGEDETAGELHDRLMELGTELVLETVARIASGDASPVGQEFLAEGALKEAPKIFKATCRIDWNDTVRNIHNKIRGLSPYPAAWTELLDCEGHASGMKIYRAVPVSHAGKYWPGEIATNGRDFIRVGTSNGYMELIEIQAAGKKRMRTEEFLRGCKKLETYRMR